VAPEEDPLLLLAAPELLELVELLDPPELLELVELPELPELLELLEPPELELLDPLAAPLDAPPEDVTPLLPEEVPPVVPEVPDEPPPPSLDASFEPPSSRVASVSALPPHAPIQIELESAKSAQAV
jgi:zinc finger protein PLAGL1